MISRRPKRGRRGAKRIDLTDMRHLFKDGRVWTGLGVVVAPNNEPHWQIVADEETGDLLDVIVEVELQPSQVLVSARLRAGMWEVPALGDEVAVIIPDGAIDFQPVIVATLSSGVVPAVQGPQPGRIVIVSGEVMIHDGNGGAEPLVRKSEFDGHHHKAPTLVGASYGVGFDPAVVTGGAATITGTTCIFAK